MHSVFSAVNAADNGTSAYSVPWAGQYYGWRRSKKYYELTNHLGNVMMTLSDSKAGVKQSSNASLIDHYNAVKLTETDYYPFGMQMQERTSSTFTANYRYGFNGKQQDDEVKGIGNQIDYGMRVYDSRLGRFLSVDPLASKYPELTPYQFAGNSPIKFIDLDGLEPAIPGKKIGEQQSGSNGSDGARTWEWNGSKWQEHTLAEVVITAKHKQITYDDLARTHPQVPLAVSGAYSSTLSLYTGRYNTYGSVGSGVMQHLTEQQKQKDFAENAPKTNAILIWEYLTGTGPEMRTFDESNPITQEIKGSESARLAALQMIIPEETSQMVEPTHIILEWRLVRTLDTLNH